jgi:hypothetical protein
LRAAKTIVLIGLIGFILMLMGGCGVKAPPVPRDSIVPKRIVDLEAIPREDRLLLTWTVPKEKTDKKALTDLDKFQILRSEGVLIADQCRGCSEIGKVVHEMRIDPESGMGGKKVSIFFEDQEPRKVYVYQIVSVNRRGYPGAPSNPATVYWDYSPSIPSRVEAGQGDKKVDLSWEPVLGATGYNVYRRGEGEVFPLKPLNRTPWALTNYTDLNVENEKSYVYSIRAVRRVVKTDIEGKGSLEISVTPTDLIAPGAPVELVAVPLKEGIELNWRRNREPDLLGYHVYRKRVGEEKFKRQNETPLTQETYLDKEVELNQEYDYAVTAVDRSARKNESSFSEEIRVKYLY